MKDKQEPPEPLPETGFSELELILAVALSSFFSGILGVIIGIFIGLWSSGDATTSLNPNLTLPFSPGNLVKLVFNKLQLSSLALTMQLA